MTSLGALLALRTNRRLLALLAAGAVSSFGDWIYLAALPVVIWDRTGNLALVGLAAIGRLVPFLVLSIPAGILADHVSPRRVLIATEAMRAGAMVAAGAVCLAGGPVILIVGLSIAAAAAGTVSFPAAATLVPRYVRDDDELGVANAAEATFDGVASIAGPALSAALIIAGGSGFAFLANAATFGFAVAVLASIGSGNRFVEPSREPEAPSDAVPARTVSPMQLLHRISRPIALDAAVSVAAGAIAVLPVAIVASWHAGSSVAPILVAWSGLGSVMGGIAAGVASGRPRAGMVVGVLVTGVAFLVLGTGSAVAAAMAMVAAGAALVLLDTLGRTWLQGLTADGTTGRAFGLLNTSASMWLMAGSALPAVLLPAVGLQVALIALASVVLGLGAVALVPTGALAFRRVRVQDGIPQANRL